MKKQLAIFVLVLLCGCTQKAKISVPEVDLNMAKVALTEFEDVLKNDNSKLWNHSLRGPILFVNPQTRTLVANEQDADGDLILSADLYTGILPESQNIANTAVGWNGTYWTMVFFPLPEEKADRLSLLAHESFHRIQPEIGFDSLFEIQSSHLDTEKGRVFLKMEVEALKKALNSKDYNKHIKNAILFRDYRYQLFPEAKKAENTLELIEGLAEYTGVILSGRNEEELVTYLRSRLDQLNDVPSFIRSFAYYTIPVYGYFMRKTDEKWNLSITRLTNLSDFISEFFNVKRSELSEKDIREIGKEYDITSISEFENNREIAKQEQISNYKVSLLGDNVMEISFEKMQISFNPNNLIPLDTFGTVYPNLRISDSWGILEVDSCGALVTNWSKVTVSGPVSISDTLISGRGWKLKLESEWKLVKQGSKTVVVRK